MTRRPWYVRWLRRIERFADAVMEEREHRRQMRAMPSYAERKQRATPTRTPQ